MHVEGLDSSLYISSPDQLTPGMELWEVGQGGVSRVCKPYFLGICVPGEEGRYAYKTPDRETVYTFSMLDKHILPQTYNNWYICSSEENAEKVYQFLKTAWETNPEYEEARLEFSHECDEMDRAFDWFDDHYDD